MSVLAIDIGNSRIGLNVFTAGKAQDPAIRLTHHQLDSELASTLRTLWEKAQGETAADDDDATAIVISSVVPETTTRVAQIADAALQQAPLLIGRDIHVPLKNMLRDEATVGQDRLLGALCAYVNTQRACVIIHAGSALVVDCVDDDGIFRGGAIAPGLAMGAKALHEFTAQLPAASITPPEDEYPFGRYTQEAINLGLYVGGRGAARELVERYATALGSWPHVVATGGDAVTLLQDAGFVDSFIPDLVLQGATLAWEDQRTKD